MAGGAPGRDAAGWGSEVGVQLRNNVCIIPWVLGNGRAVRGLQELGTPFVCAQAGELYLWSSKDVQNNTEYDRDWDGQDPHHPRAHSGVPALLCPIAAWLGLSRGICMGLSHRHLNIRIPQPPKLQSKETFVKESSAQTVPEETPTM